jgi:hypothetical protein
MRKMLAAARGAAANARLPLIIVAHLSYIRNTE